MLVLVVEFMSSFLSDGVSLLVAWPKRRLHFSLLVEAERVIDRGEPSVQFLVFVA